MAPSIPPSAAYSKSRLQDEFSESDSEDNFVDWKCGKSGNPTKREDDGAVARREEPEHYVVNLSSDQEPNTITKAAVLYNNIAIDLISDDDSALDNFPLTQVIAAIQNAVNPRESAADDRKQSPVQAMNSSTGDEECGSKQESATKEPPTSPRAEASTREKDEDMIGRNSDHKKVWTDDGCLRPKTRTKAADGTYSRPQGRGPKGFTWDARRGVYAPNCAQISASYYGSSFEVEQQVSVSPSTIKRTASEIGRSAEARDHKRSKKNPCGTRDGPSVVAGTSKASVAALKPLATSSELGNTGEEIEPGAELASRVYFEWKKNNWHWATIVGVSGGPDSASKCFSLVCDDKEYIHSVPRSRFETIQSLHDLCVERGVCRSYYSPPALRSDVAAGIDRMLKSKNVVRSVAMGVSLKKRKVANKNDDFLVGRIFRRTWTDFGGQRKVVYGEVTGCEEDLVGDVTACNVQYSEESREEAMNMSKNRCGLIIPESQSLRPELVIGACLCYEAQLSPENPLSDFRDLPFHWKWTFPESIREDLVDGFPRVTIICRGYKLELRVKDSSIEGAGLGVFLSCKPVVNRNTDDRRNVFTLAPGELLDFGIYGPLDIQDKKCEAVFFTKNFIHSSKCEEWAFDPSDVQNPGHQLDMTDDVTGDLHPLAKNRIQAYVNESNDKRKVCVHACHDPENSVHFLLGHGLETQGEFAVPADGGEREILIDYGEGYEKVRVRKGYSSRPMDEQQTISKELENEDVESILSMSQFSAAEVTQASNFLFALFTGDEETKFTEKVIERALVCAAVLQRQMRDLFVEDDDGKTFSGHQKTLFKQSRMLVRQLLKLTEGNHDAMNQLQAANDVNGLLKVVLERQRFTPKQRKDLLELGE